MPLLQVKDCPARVHDQLRTLAKEEHRTMAQQVIVILENFFDEQDSRSKSSDGVVHEIPATHYSDQAQAYHVAPAPTSASASVPTPVPATHSVYAYRETSQERQQRIERRRKVFESIEKRGPVPLPKGYESAADIIREAREERDAQIWANLQRSQGSSATKLMRREA